MAHHKHAPPLDATEVSIVERGKEVKTLDEISQKEWLAPREIALLLGVSTDTIGRLLDAGELGSVRVSERIRRIRKSDLEAFLDADSGREQVRV